MSPRARHFQSRPTGFSLVEIMVGMVIGMLGIIVMMQVFSLAEGQKRTTTGGSDAQTNGAIAMYGVQRDIRQAGYGISDLRIIGCDLLLPNGVKLNPMAPVIINPLLIPGGDPNTDTLLIVYGNTNGSPQGDLSLSTNVTSNVYTLTAAPTFAAMDFVIAVPWGDDGKGSQGPVSKRPTQTALTPTPPACGLVLDKVASTTAVNVTVTTGMPPVAGVPALAYGSFLFNLGQAPRILAYAIRNGNLMRCDFAVVEDGAVASWSDCSDAAAATAANAGQAQTLWSPVADNIVSMRAQYGRDTTVAATSPKMDGIVDIFDQTPPALQTAASPAPAPDTRCGWTRISAVRLVLVGRSAQYDKTVVTGNVPTSVPTWMGSTAGNPAGSAAAPIDLSTNTDWQHYRYKVFQTVVPIRNVTWQGAPVEC